MALVWGMKWSDTTSPRLEVGAEVGWRYLAGPQSKRPGCSQSGICFDLEVTPPLITLLLK